MTPKDVVDKIDKHINSKTIDDIFVSVANGKFDLNNPQHRESLSTAFTQIKVTRAALKLFEQFIKR